MHDGIGLIIIEGLGEQPAVTEVAAYEPAAEDRPLVTGLKLIVYEDVMAVLAEKLYYMAADITGPAGDKYLHV